MKTCTFPGCGAKHRCRGYCNLHYRRLMRHGDPSVTAYDRSQGELFWSHVDKSGECWIWTGARRGPYGLFNTPPTTTGTHRYAYELEHGSIPDGKVIDHICRVKLCVNPAHLQAVEPILNNQNHSGPTRQNKSGVRGVWWCATTRRWRGQVRLGGRRFDIGSHSTLESAEQAILTLRLELHSNNLRDREAGL